MMRRTLTAATAATCLALSLAACGGGSDGEESEAGASSVASFTEGTTMADIQAAGTMTVGTKFDQPGFGLTGLDGVPAGFDVEVAKIIGAAMGIAAEDITYVETPSAVREEKIEQGAVDLVVATYTINDERRERVSFAGPYYTAGQDIMVAADDTAITGPESFTADPALKVCSVTGSTPAETIKSYLASDDQLVLFDVYSKCADALGTGQVDAVTTDNTILLGLADDSDGAYKLVGKPFTEEPYGIGITKGDTEFCEFIDETLTAAAESGAYEEAWTSTAGQVEGSTTPELPAFDACS